MAAMERARLVMPRTKYTIISSSDEGLLSKPVLEQAIRTNPPRIERHPKTKNIQTVIVAIALKIAGILTSLIQIMLWVTQNQAMVSFHCFLLCKPRGDVTAAIISARPQKCNTLP